MTAPSAPPAYTVVSAPGKVLMAGGYLVLDPEYSGLVVSTSSRFYCAVSTLSGSSSGRSASGDHDSSSSSAKIRVRAGQFPRSDSTWTYELSRSSDSGSSADDSGPSETLVLRQIESVGRNKFVEKTLVKALELAWEVIERDLERKGGSSRELIRRIRGHGEGLDLVMLADNDFYSQREQLSAANLPRKLSSLATLQPFSPLPRPIHRTNKTGLGSSAALVTSLTAGLLQHLGIVDIPSPKAAEASHIPSGSTATPQTSSSLDLVHNLAQLSHCSAQGKVGSGFDISSAVYGTHQYKRFSPSVLAPLLASTGSDPETILNSSRTLLPAITSPAWDHTTRPFRLPRGLRLMLADVDAGTDTPSFVGKLLKWRENQKSVADDLWRSLGEANDSLGEQLRRLDEMQDEEGYAEALLAIARGQSLQSPSPIVDTLRAIREQLEVIRQHMRQMSRLSDVPIEPPEQSRLLDACCSLPGVIGGGVPGAGGYDALFLLVIDTPSVIDSVAEVWATWTEMSVCPLSARQSDGGLRLEEVTSVPGLSEALQRP